MINIEFESITITGFGSIKKELTFQIKREPGLYYINGVNLDEPALGSNGAGKSTLWDAISWSCFGKTVDGSFGEDVINWQSSTCKVITHLSKDGIAATITRTQAPNLITLQVGEAPPEVVVQSVLDKFLNLDHDRFIHCLIVGQFNSTFLEHKPAEKLQMFSDIMALDFWERCSEKASTCSAVFEKDIQILGEKLRGLSTKQSDQKARREVLDANQRGWDKVRQTTVLDLTKKADDLHYWINQVETINNEQQVLLAKANTEHDGIKLDLDRVKSNIEAINNQKRIFEKDWDQDQNQSTIIKKSLDKWKTLTDKCPTCEQEVNKEFAATEKQRLTKEYVVLGKRLKEDERLVKELEAQITVNNTKRKELEGREKISMESVKELSSSVIKIAYDKEAKLQEMRHIREKINAENTEANPYNTLLDLLDKEMLITLSEVEQVNQDLEEANKGFKGTEFWVKGFKELRMWVISDALSALEIESNNALSKLGLMDWKIKFQMERETQKGGVSRGFHVMVHSKRFTKDKFLPLKKFSGGEARRLKLSGVIGFSSLIQNYTGVEFNMSVWDEPSSYLSKEGIDDLIEFLSEQAETNQKVIYFADQRQLEASNFKSVITMTKTDEGTSIGEQ